MTLQQLNYIIAVSEAGSLNKAAEALYISQPSLTSAIREVEKEAGIQIFIRSGRGMTLTQDGLEFLPYAREVVHQYEALQDRYGSRQKRRKKFAVTAQHYSFVTQAFVETVKQFDTSKYEFSMLEARTSEVMEDVRNLRSEIGVLFLSDFNRKALEKILKSYELEFHGLIRCQAYVYLWKDHPLAGEDSITFDQLQDYPCISFDQGGNNAFYYAEEILSTSEYPRVIKTNDRATNLNLMKGLNGYTLCSGVIAEDLNGSDYVSIPYEGTEENPNSDMEIGYIKKHNSKLSAVGEVFIEKLINCLKHAENGEMIFSGE